MLHIALHVAHIPIHIPHIDSIPAPLGTRTGDLDKHHRYQKHHQRGYPACTHVPLPNLLRTQGLP